MNDDSGRSEAVGTWVAATATAAAVAAALAARAIRGTFGWRFPGWAEQGVECAWMAALLVITVIGSRLTAGRPPTAADFGLARAEPRPVRRRRSVGRGAGALVMLAVVVGGAVASSDTSVPADEPRMTTALWVFTCLVRWPVSTVAQQVLYFGWLQPRLRHRAPILAALLYAGSHVASPGMLPIVIPLGLVFAYERERTGRIHAGIATHYASEVLFVLAHR